jgi:hypothetical protein
LTGKIALCIVHIRKSTFLSVQFKTTAQEDAAAESALTSFIVYSLQGILESLLKQKGGLPHILPRLMQVR